jgi:ferredoxin
VEAIYPDDEVPMEWEHYIELNERLAEKWSSYVINEHKEDRPDADEWAEVEDKFDLLEEDWD